MIRLTWDNDKQRGTIDRDGGPIPTTRSLTVAVVLSLFCWAPRELDTIPGPGQERRGYWADRYARVPGDRWGSELWQLLVAESNEPRRRGGRLTEEFMELGRGAIERALAWMVRDGIAQSVDVTVERWEGNKLAFATEIRAAGGETYADEWEATLA